MNNWETLITFTYPHEAHLAKGFLESEGIKTIIHDEMTVQVQNFYSNAVGGVKILVQKEDYDDGIAVLKKGGYIINADNQTEEVRIVEVDESNNKTHCPFCKSDNIAKIKGVNILTPIVYLILGAIFPIFNSKYKCYDCEKEWRYRKSKGRNHNSNANSLIVWGIVVITMASAYAGYGQSTRQSETLRAYRTEIEHLLLPANNHLTQTNVVAAFLVHPYLDPDYSVCLKDSAEQMYLELRLLDKNLWSELLSRFIQKQSLDVSIKVSIYSASVNKRYKKEMLTAFTKITPRKVSDTSPVNSNSTSYEFRWIENGEMKNTTRSHDLNAESYESELIKILDQLAFDLRNNTFKEEGVFNQLK